MDRAKWILHICQTGSRPECSARGSMARGRIPSPSSHTLMTKVEKEFLYAAEVGEDLGGTAEV